MNTFQISKFWNLELFEKQSKCKLQLTITIAPTGHLTRVHRTSTYAQDVTKNKKYTGTVMIVKQRCQIKFLVFSGCFHNSENPSAKFLSVPESKHFLEITFLKILFLLVMRTVEWDRIVRQNIRKRDQS